ncbi:MAG: type I pantothenate kinase [Actinomycetia bacterium]|nr:type I pantothenate kinase [Actinomycetes bacterium]MCP4958264.1 type I pantothenate kinase [Actinomycetes bacterium]
MASDRYLTFTRAEWAELRANTPLTLAEDDLDRLSGLNDPVDLEEVEMVHLPIGRLLNLEHSANAALRHSTSQFLGAPVPAVPYVIGVAGSVAAGKSTFARILRALLARWPEHPRVELVTTDGFLHPNATLEQRGLMERKGFPESYDTAALLEFLQLVKSGVGHIEVPTYSHVVYDVVDDVKSIIKQPDIVIVEGLNVLQVGTEAADFVSDYFDFSIYLDADVEDIERWYVDRFLALRETVFRDPQSYFAKYAHLNDDEARATATSIWDRINGINLRDHIAPTRERASLILHKAADHRIDEVNLLRR